MIRHFLPPSLSHRHIALLTLSAPAIYFTSRKMSAPSSSKGPNSSASSPNINNDPTFPTHAYHPRHTTWPYTSADFTRSDPSPDPSFYSTPRFVTHIDDNAIASLREYYAQTLPLRGRVLDLCSSWVSHLPRAHEDAALVGREALENGDGEPQTMKGMADGEEDAGALEVVGLGMNEKELEKNAVLRERVLRDLNERPMMPEGIGGTEGLDATVCVVSVDYLTKPREVLGSVREATKIDGMVHLVMSNRCFPTKAVARWLRVSEEERLRMVGDYLWFSGWRDIEIVEVSNGKNENRPGGLMGMFGGMMGGDPLWVVRGKKVGKGPPEDEFR